MEKNEKLQNRGIVGTDFALYKGDTILSEHQRGRAMLKERRILGCIADDFTGASDAASFLQKAGLRTVLLSDVPDQPIEADSYDALVVALKTRTELVHDAVEHTMNAVKWLENNGATNYYLKYCSTFDSTKEGNIGPIMDAVLEYFEEPYTILCPALPVNGRIVKDGHLYVNGVPLHESPMKDHPLTPMWDSRIKNLMEAQSKYVCYELNSKSLRNTSVAEEIEKWKTEHEHFYIVPDYQSDEDGEYIAKLFRECKVLSGGSGILAFLERRREKGILLAGSCSKATLNQIEIYQKAGHPSYKIDPFKLWNGEVKISDIINYVETFENEYVLIFSSDSADNVKESQKLGKEKIAQLLEETMSEIAKQLMEKGYHHIIVAGGETSGAVTKKLGYHSFEIGKSVAPGVPLMIPVEDKSMRIVLKSGNFGQPDFFEEAIRIAKGE